MRALCKDCGTVYGPNTQENRFKACPNCSSQNVSFITNEEATAIEVKKYNDAHKSTCIDCGCAHGTLIRQDSSEGRTYYHHFNEAACRDAMKKELVRLRKLVPKEEKPFIDYLREFGKASHVHMHLNVVDFVKRPLNRYPKGLFTKDDGSEMTRQEARDALIEELLKGHRVIPCGKCDNFDYSGRGCGGHPVEEKKE